MIGGRQVLAHGRGDLGLKTVQLSLQQPEAFAGELDHRGLFLARVGASASATDAQTRAEIGFGHALGLEIGQKGLETFDACCSLARGVGEVLLVTLDFQLRDLGDGPICANVPHETVDLAGCQLPLARGKPAQVLRRNLTQALRVGFLALTTPPDGPNSGGSDKWLNYREAHGPA